MDIHGLSGNQVAKLVHSYLNELFWPEHLQVGDEFSLQADDQDGKDTGWITIRIPDKETIMVETNKKMPDKDSTTFEYVDMTYQFTTTRAEHPLVFQALLGLALAFRADSHRSGWHELPSEVITTKSQKLRRLYKLLDHLPWIGTLNVQTYLIEGDMSPWPESGANCGFGVMITEANDDWLIIGYAGERFRNGMGGGIYVYTCSALRILAEAIRMENEGT